jgi:hypothetical protein
MELGQKSRLFSKVPDHQVPSDGIEEGKPKFVTPHEGG